MLAAPAGHQVAGFRAQGFLFADFLTHLQGEQQAQLEGAGAFLVFQQVLDAGDTLVQGDFFQFRQVFF